MRKTATLLAMLFLAATSLAQVKDYREIKTPPLRKLSGLMLKSWFTFTNNLNCGFTALLVPCAARPYAPLPHGPARNPH